MIIPSTLKEAQAEVIRLRGLVDTLQGEVIRLINLCTEKQTIIDDMRDRAMQVRIQLGEDNR